MKATETVFPSIAHPYAGGLPIQQGLTKREYFAGLAMQGAIASLSGTTGAAWAERGGIIKSSIEMADALLAELSKEQK